MSLDAALPHDVETLRALVLSERQAAAAARAEADGLSDQLRQARAGLVEKALEIEALKAQLARLRRMRFGRSSEKLDRQIVQLELKLGDLEEELGQSEQRVPSPPAPQPEDRARPVRRPLPDHLPREEVVHAAADACPACGGAARARWART